MQKVTTEGNDIALYILARMYYKHVFVHNLYRWSTLPYRMEDSYKDLVHKCDLELIFLKCWAFGEVKQIRGPVSVPKTSKSIIKKGMASKETDTPPVDTDVIPGNDDTVDVIPHNVLVKLDRVMRK